MLKFANMVCALVYTVLFIALFFGHTPGKVEIGGAFLICAISFLNGYFNESEAK